MKASELIQKLQELMAMHGDCEVWVESYDWDFDHDISYPVNEIDFDEEHVRFSI